MMLQNKLKGTCADWLPFILNATHENASSFVIVVENNKKLHYIESIFKAVTNLQEVIFFESFESDAYESIVLEKIAYIKKAAALERILNCKYCIIVATVQAMSYLLPHSEYFAEIIWLQCGQTISIDNLTRELISFGYERVEIVECVGQFSVRGGILDLFSPTNASPIRIDFMANAIDAIREFAVETQISFRNVDAIKVPKITFFPEFFPNNANIGKEFFPNNANIGKEFFPNNTNIGKEWQLAKFHEKTVSILEYIKNANFIFDFEIEKHNKIFFAEAQQRYNSLPADSVLPVLQIFYNSIAEIAEKYKVLRLNPFEIGDYFIKHQKQYNIKISNDLTQLINEIDEQTIFSVTSQGAKNILCKMLSLANFDEKKIIISPLQYGFCSAKIKLYTEYDLFGCILKFRAKKTKSDFFTEYSQIKTADYVIHEDYGIAIFAGVMNLSISDIEHDFLCLVYKNNDKLYVPVENISLISRYGEGEHTIELDVLKGISWKKRKNNVRKKLLIVANNLLTIAAKRKMQKIQPYEIATEEYDKFCRGFEYIETDDQLTAIEDVVLDLQKDYPTERLICGDVGFGKTEIALRAAFVIANNLKQVVLLAPTTILVSQHYKNFVKRFAGFDIKIGKISRFSSSKERKENIEKIKNGALNIIIATHAILSRAVEFFDLGLIIIDEEQHFGVKQKEKMREQNPEAHFLTLSATPIPRTLQMAVSGIWEMSMITTPPMQRLAPKTFVSNCDVFTIKNAIEKELNRKGQVFFVSPRVEYLQNIYNIVQQAFPNIPTAVVSGKTQNLEEIIVDFCDKKIDILISTNIIDSGIDISNANTILVYRADLFGLAQLYQLRGRVGRSTRQAYAYFLLSEEKVLTENSQKRLDVLISLNKLGAGFSLASNDLDIRGAGNMLGDEQSGYIKEVGVELYQKLLQEAILMLKSADNSYITKFSPQINIGLPIFIPSSYINEKNLKLEIYRKIGLIKNEIEIDAVKFEILNRFGIIPKEMQNLFLVVELMCYCKISNIEKIDVGLAGFSLSFFNNECPKFDKLLKFFQSDFIHKNHGQVKIKKDNRIVITKRWKNITQRTMDVFDIVREISKL